MCLGLPTTITTANEGLPTVLTHVVLFTLNDRNDADELLNRLRSLPGQIPSLISMRCGKNALDKPNSWDIALTTEHADADGLKDYLAHPIHLELLEWLNPRISGRAVVDSTDFR